MSSQPVFQPLSGAAGDSAEASERSFKAASSSGHVSGRNVTAAVVVGSHRATETSADARHATAYAESHAGSEPRSRGSSGGSGGMPQPAAGTAAPVSGPSSRRTTSSDSSGVPFVDSHAWANTRINADFAALVASVAPLELTMLTAKKQQARKAKSTDAAANERRTRVPGTQVSPGSGDERETKDIKDRARTLIRPALRPLSAGAATSRNAASRSRSRSPQRAPSAGAAKGPSVRRDPTLLPNPVLAKQSEEAQRKQAVAEFMQRLQANNDLKRAEAAKRLEAEQQQLTEQLAAEAEDLKAAAQEVTQVPEPKPPSIKPRARSAGSKSGKAGGGAAAGLGGLERIDASGGQEQKVVKPLDPKPWRHNMRRKPTPLSSEQPAGAPGDVAVRPVIDGPPAQNLAPPTVSSRIKDLDPVAQAQLQDYMKRKKEANDRKLAQEREAQQLQRTKQQRVAKEEAVRAREIARKFAEDAEHRLHKPRAPRPAWENVEPDQAAAPAGLPQRRTRPILDGDSDMTPDFDIQSQRALPHHTNQAVLAEAQQWRQQQRALRSGISPVRGQHREAWSPLNDMDGDFAGGPQVVRVRDPPSAIGNGRVYRRSSAQPTRPLATAQQAQTTQQLQEQVAQVKQQVLAALIPMYEHDDRRLDLDSRLAARKQFEARMRLQNHAQASAQAHPQPPQPPAPPIAAPRGRSRSPKTQVRRSNTASPMGRKSPTGAGNKRRHASRSQSRNASAGRQRPISAPAGARDAAVEAEVAKAKQAAKAKDAWELALQLHARLEALQQRQPAAAGLSPRTSVLGGRPDVAASLHTSVAGAAYPTAAYAQPQAPLPAAMPPAGYMYALPAGVQMQPSELSSPAVSPTKAFASGVQQFDEGVQAGPGLRPSMSGLRPSVVDSPELKAVAKKPRMSMDNVSDISHGFGVRATDDSDTPAPPKARRSLQVEPAVPSLVPGPIIQIPPSSSVQLLQTAKASNRHVDDSARRSDALTALRPAADEEDVQAALEAMRAAQAAEYGDMTTDEDGEDEGPVLQAADLAEMLIDEDAAVHQLLPGDDDVAGGGVGAASGAEPMQADPSELSSIVSSGQASPVQPCEDIMQEYEADNSPLRLKPAQREVLRAAAAESQKRAIAANLFNPDEDDFDKAMPMSAASMHLSSDPMSIINLLTQRGPAVGKPTIIKLPVGLERPADSAETLAGLPLAPVQTTEVLMFPGPRGARLLVTREPAPAPATTVSPPAKRSLLRETGVGEGRIDMMDTAAGIDLREAQTLSMSLPPFVILPPPHQQQQNPLYQPVFGSGMQQPVLSDNPLYTHPGLSEGAMRSNEYMPFESPQPQSMQQAEPPQGAMASPPPRPRTVTFVDEVAGPPDRVRLAPTELFRQMQDTLKTFGEVEAAERDLLQLENARAIALVQREAHRIAQRLDNSVMVEHTAAKTAELVAKAQEDTEARLRSIEDSLRAEVRAEAATNLRDVTSIFLQQLTRHKIANAEVQTTPVRRFNPEIGVQVEVMPTVPLLNLHSPGVPPSAPAPWHSPSPPPSARARSPALPAAQPSAVSMRSAQRRSTAASAIMSEYSETFEEDTTAAGGSVYTGRPVSRATLRQPSTMSIPESIPAERSRATQYGRASLVDSVYSEAMPARSTRQPSFASDIPESVYSRSAMLQHSTMSVPETVYSEGGAPTAQHSMTQSIAESIPYTTRTVRSRRQSVASTIATAFTGRASEPQYSADFVEDEDMEDEVEEEMEEEVQEEEVEEESSIPDERSSSPSRRTAQQQKAAAAAAARFKAKAQEHAAQLSPPSQSARSLAAQQAASSPLTVRASKGAGLDVDPAGLQAYAAESEARMREEVARLQDRLHSLEQIASQNMAHLEAELRSEAAPERRQALMRAQRMLQMQHDADVQDLYRQIAAVKGDHARQRIQLEQLSRLALVTSPTPALRPAYPAPAPAATAAAGRSTPSGQPVRGRQPAAPSTRAPSPGASTAVAEESMEGTAQSASIVDEATMTSEPYSEEFEAASRRSHPAAAAHTARPPKPARQSSSIVDEIEETLSQRYHSSGSPGPSNVSEEIPDNGRSSSGKPGRSSGTVGTETYSEEFDTTPATTSALPAKPPKPASKTVAKPAPAAKGRSAPPAHSSSQLTQDSELQGDTASELSARSADLDRQKAMLAKALKQKEKQIREEARRAKIAAKEAEIKEMQRQLAALEQQKVSPPSRPSTAGKQRSTQQAGKHRSRSSVSESSIQESSVPYTQTSGSVAEESEVTDEVQSVPAESLPEEGSGTVVSESMAGGSEATSRRDHRKSSRHKRSASSASRSRSGSEPYSEQASGSAVSMTPSERHAEQRLAAMRAQVEAREKELKRLKLEAEEKALQAKLRELDEQAKAIKASTSRPASKPSSTPARTQGHAPARPAASDSISEEMYSDDHLRSGTSGARSGSVVDEVGMASGSTHHGPSKSGSVADEVGAASGSTQQRSRSGTQSVMSEMPTSGPSRGSGPAGRYGSQSHSSSVVDELGRSGAGSGSGTHVTNRSGTIVSEAYTQDSYTQDFDEDGRGFTMRDADEIMDEVATAGDDSGMTSGGRGAGALEPIEEDDMAARSAATPSGPSAAPSGDIHDEVGQSAGHSPERSDEVQDVEEYEVDYEEDLEAEAEVGGSGETTGDVASEEELPAGASGETAADVASDEELQVGEGTATASGETAGHVDEEEEDYSNEHQAGASGETAGHVESEEELQAGEEELETAEVEYSDEYMHDDAPAPVASVSPAISADIDEHPTMREPSETPEPSPAESEVPAAPSGSGGFTGSLAGSSHMASIEYSVDAEHDEHGEEEREELEVAEEEQPAGASAVTSGASHEVAEEEPEPEPEEEEEQYEVDHEEIEEESGDEERGELLMDVDELLAIDETATVMDASTLAAADAAGASRYQDHMDSVMSEQARTPSAASTEVEAGGIEEEGGYELDYEADVGEETILDAASSGATVTASAALGATAIDEEPSGLAAAASLVEEVEAEEPEEEEEEFEEDFEDADVSELLPADTSAMQRSVTGGVSAEPSHTSAASAAPPAAIASASVMDAVASESELLASKVPSEEASEYTEDFSSSSTLPQQPQPSASIVQSGQLPSVMEESREGPLAAAAAESRDAEEAEEEASAVEEVEELEVDYEEEPEDGEEAESPAAPPLAIAGRSPSLNSLRTTSRLAMAAGEHSQRYAATEASHSSGYSQDFAAEEELAPGEDEEEHPPFRDSTAAALAPASPPEPEAEELEAPGAQAREASYTMDFGAEESTAAEAAPAAAASLSASESVFEVEDDMPSGTVSSEPSAKGEGDELLQPPLSKPGEPLAAHAQAGDDNTLDFGEAEATAEQQEDQEAELPSRLPAGDDYTLDFGEADDAAEPEPAAAVPTSHPITTSPPAEEDEEMEVEEEVEEVEEEEVPVAEDDDEEPPQQAAAAGLPMGQIMSVAERALKSQLSDGGGISRSSSGISAALRDPEAEDSGIIAVPTGMGIRQTRRLESRIYRSGDRSGEETEDDWAEAELDLVDMSMTAGDNEGRTLLEMLGADLIEASESITPTHSFRLREGSGSASPFAPSTLQRASTLKMPLSPLAEGGPRDEELAAISPAKHPEALQEQEEQQGEGEAEEVDAEEVAEEVEEVGEQEEEQESSAVVLAPAPVPAKPPPEEEEEEEGPPAAEEPSTASAVPAPAPQEEASEEEYSGVEAPDDEVSEGGGDYELDVTGLGSNSDDVFAVAAAFESQAIGEEDDEGVAQEYSAISASGMSDDLGQYKVAVEPEEGEEAAAPPAMAAVAEAPAEDEEMEQPEAASEDVLAAAAAAGSAAESREPSAPASQEPSEVIEEVAEDEELEMPGQMAFDGDESAGDLATQLSRTALAALSERHRPPLSVEVPDSARDDAGHQEVIMLGTTAGAATEPSGATPPKSGSPSSSNSLDPAQLSRHLPDDDEDEVGVAELGSYRALYKQDSLGPADYASPAAAPVSAAPGLLRLGSGKDGEGEQMPQEGQEAGADEESFDLAKGLTGLAASGEGAPSAAEPARVSGGAMLMALLDEPDDGNASEYSFPKGDFESEIEEMLSASRARSRDWSTAGGLSGALSNLQSPYQSIAWSEPGTPEAGANNATPFTGASSGGVSSARATVAAVGSRLAALAQDPAFLSGTSLSQQPSSGSMGPEPEYSSGFDADGELSQPATRTPSATARSSLLASLHASGVVVPEGADAEADVPEAEPGSDRDKLINEITEDTMQAMVSEAIDGVVAVAGGEAQVPGTRSAGALAAAAAAAATALLVPQPASPRGTASAVQVNQGPRHRLAVTTSYKDQRRSSGGGSAASEAPSAAAQQEPSSVHDGEDEDEERVLQEVMAEKAPYPSKEAEEELEEPVAEQPSISGSLLAEELSGDIEIEEPAMELPSPLASDSGSIGSPLVRSTMEQEPAVAESAAPPALRGEPSEADLARQTSEGKEDGFGAGGLGLTSDEDLGWGASDELEGEVTGDDWQPDLSGYIAPEIDQAQIERENAPAVVTTPQAISQYVDQVLQQFVDERPEMLVTGAEPLSLEGFLAMERNLPDASEAQHIHNKMLYDAINEALLATYRQANRVQAAPWARHSRPVKPLPPPEVMMAQVQEQVRAWSAVRIREPSDIDKVLAADAAEDERAIADTSAEEAEVQREVADAIWDELIGDTAEVLAALERQLTAGHITGTSASTGRKRLA